MNPARSRLLISCTITEPTDDKSRGAAGGGDQGGDRLKLARTLQEQVMAGAPIAPELLEALAAAVLDQPAVRLALQVRAEGAARLGPALELAALVLREGAAARWAAG